MVQDEQIQDVGLFDILVELSGGLLDGLPLMAEVLEESITLYLFTFDPTEEHYRRVTVMDLSLFEGKIVFSCRQVVPEPDKEKMRHLDPGDPNMEASLIDMIKDAYEQTTFFFDIYGISVVEKPSDRLKEWLSPASGNDVVIAEVIDMDPQDWGSD